MKARLFILFFIVFITAFVVAFVRVYVFWDEGKLRPKLGDWNYYVQACNHMPMDHPIVPLMLHTTNFFLRNPDLTVLSSMVLGYTLMFALSFTVPFTFKYHLVACLGSFFIVALADYRYLTPTALKNIWAVNFLLLTLLIFPKTENIKWQFKVSTVVITFVTFLTHTVSFFALFPVTLCHLTDSGKNRKFYFAIALLFMVTVCVGLFLLPQMNRLSKLNEVIGSFITNPVGIALYNIRRVLVDYRIATYLTVFLTAAIISTLSVAYTRKFDPMLYGLFFTYAGLFLLGSPLHQAFTGRFHETGIPIIGILFAYILTTEFQFYRYAIAKIKDLHAQTKEAIK